MMTCIFQNLALIYEEKSWRQILKYFLECATKPTRGNFRTNVVFSGKEVLLVLKNESEVNQLERVFHRRLLFRTLSVSILKRKDLKLAHFLFASKRVTLRVKFLQS